MLKDDERGRGGEVPLLKAHQVVPHSLHCYTFENKWWEHDHLSTGLHKMNVTWFGLKQERNTGENGMEMVKDTWLALAKRVETKVETHMHCRTSASP